MTVDRNREVQRDEIARILGVALTSDVQDVWNYYKGDFEGRAVVVIVSSLGSQRPKFTLQGRKLQARYQIVVYVLYGDSRGGWDEADAEDKLDEIEQKIYNALDAYTCHGDFWKSLEVNNPNGFSAVDFVAIGGTEYKRETITVQTEL